jgi:squalene-hopene/tetraprenyl-beta-curcumene cyclase
VIVLLVGLGVVRLGAVPLGAQEEAAKPTAIVPDEPLAKSFSLKKAADYLDLVALDWQKERRCGTCHTNFAYLMARPSISSVSPPRAEVRSFFESMVEKRWKEKGPRWPAEVVVAATTLAANDRATTRRLHATTRKALDRMWTLQREDGGWDWLICGWPPMESDDHYGVTFAAIGVGLAPDDYAKTAAAKKGLEGIRKFLLANPSLSLHHKAMELWASMHVDGLLEKKKRRRIVDELFARQRPDGGWAIAALIEGCKDHERKDGKKQDLETSDGYGTSFVVYVLREAGVPSDDARIRKAIAWIKSNQRESGRWFTRSPTKDSKHFISNAGTAFAVMALSACGEVKK